MTTYMPTTNGRHVNHGKIVDAGASWWIRRTPGRHAAVTA
jgi:hypothetical protein